MFPFIYGVLLLLWPWTPHVRALATKPHVDIQSEHNTTTNEISDTAFNATNPSLRRRWFSIPTSQELGNTDHRKVDLWPIQKFEVGDPIYPKGGTRRLIPFCFENEESADALKHATAIAIAQWWPAFEKSSLVIIPDRGCYVSRKEEFRFRCICGEQPTSARTLRIALADAIDESNPDPTKGGVEKRMRQSDMSHCTLGCNTAPGNLAICHRLVIGRMEEKADREKRVVAQMADMTHELGHAMGLLHEHQRPDRDRFVSFFCHNVEGFAEAEAMADSQDYAQDWEPGLTLHDKMARICSDESWAEKYFPEAKDFVKQDRSLDGYEGIRFDDDYFDYASIMTYGSFADEIDAEHAALVRRRPQGVPPELPRTRKDGSVDYEDGYFYAGGMVGDIDVRISTMDVKRIGQLYPGTQEQTNTVAALQPGMSWKPIRTKDMIFSPAWGHQLGDILKDWLLSPNFPDVVDANLHDCFERELRWARWYGHRALPDWPDLRPYRERADEMEKAMRRDAGMIDDPVAGP